ncbi:MAG: AMP-binding protein, partial [Terriglobales bacterium]
MLGLMQDQPLLISGLIDFAARHHRDAQIVSRRVEGDIHRTTYADAARRAKQVAGALERLKLGFSDRVATLAWNGYRHFELYFGIAGSGRVMHTINPRLAPDQVAWIANHAEDHALFFDLTFLPVVEKIAALCKTVKAFVLLTDRAHMPATSAIPNLLCYEDLLAAAPDEYAWPQFDENRAAVICFTSGTTGNPKGVVYSHRSTLLHTFGVALPDSLNLSAREVVLPVVPMFHVNAWGIPYAAAMTGAKLVFPGAALDGKSLFELIEAEKVTVSAGVPTVWQGLLNYAEQHGLNFSTMRRAVIGGSALPPTMLRTFAERYKVQTLHAWGMTEMSPLGTACSLRSCHDALSLDARNAILTKQGRAVFGVDMKIVDPDGKELPWDGKASGDLLVRGPWVVREYFKG